MINLTYQTIKTNGENAIQEIVKRITSQQNLVKVTIFVDASDNQTYTSKKQLLDQLMGQAYNNCPPPYGLIAQKPLDCTASAELTCLEQQDDTTMSFVANTALVESSNQRMLIVGALVAENLDGNFAQATQDVFDQLDNILKDNNFTVGDIFRQWNYIDNITGYNGPDQRYQVFNDIRSALYQGSSWDKGYPAATGIGTQAAETIVELIAIQDKQSNNFGIDNSLQIAAHNYSQDVLYSKKEVMKTTPKFERARLFGNNTQASIQISGTAAIRGELSLTSHDIAQQTQMTMENIEFLCSPQNIKDNTKLEYSSTSYATFRVYIKNEDQMPQAKEYMDKNYVNIDTAYLLADICRDELLIEIEGVAHIKA